MRRFNNSFSHAYNGVKYAMKTERNFRIQLFIGGIATVCAVLFKVNRFEMTSLIFSIVLVLFAELINTSIESVVDLITEEFRTQAKIAKDVAAAAVLITAANSVVVGLIIFIPKVIERLD